MTVRYSLHWLAWIPPIGEPWPPSIAPLTPTLSDVLCLPQPFQHCGSQVSRSTLFMKTEPGLQSVMADP